MLELKKYKHKEIWERKNIDFCIEIVRWEIYSEEQLKGLNEKGVFLTTGRFVWNIYCYIYPNHRLFNTTTYEGYCPVKNFHSGCTYSKWHFDNENKEIISKEYGCDYSSERFTYMEKPEEVIEIFNDAEELFKELS